ncbi:hypothetical protein PRO82_001132 [Candidatus Protochlamydia amoebophila]|nr:hypothetical protein [Candidatus Protochlamydia amoebophila]
MKKSTLHKIHLSFTKFFYNYFCKNTKFKIPLLKKLQKN